MMKKNKNVNVEIEENVSEHVIDAALEAMRAHRKSSGFFHKHGYSLIRFGAPILVTMILILAILPILMATNVIPSYGNNSVNDGSVTYYSDLTKHKMESIEWYNNEFKTEYRYLKDAELKESYYLTDDYMRIVMVEEHYLYNGVDVILYTYINSFNSVMLNDCFENYFYIDDNIVFYGQLKNDEEILSTCYFNILDTGIYLDIYSTSQEFMEEVIKKVIN